jgi:8-hydroxy-5-deazaflavin:NADPH oxidoreductase
MRIGIIGSGQIGSTAARRFVRLGHEVRIANSRGPQSMRSLVRELGPSAEATTVEDAARFGDVVLVAILLFGLRAMPGEAFTGKIVVDPNNYFAGRNGYFPVLDRGELTHTELFATQFPGTRIVKGFNTLSQIGLANRGRPDASWDERLALYAAGDDEEAKRVVLDLYDALGYAPIDAGPLVEGGRRLQPGGPVFNADLTGAQARRVFPQTSWQRGPVADQPGDGSASRSPRMN